MADIEALIEAERRGILPQDKAPLLAEARRRGLAGGGDGGEQPQVAPVTAQPPRYPNLEKGMEQATIPLLTGAAGFLPGGPIIQAAIGGAGETINELAQGEELDAKKIAMAAAVPGAARGLVNSGRAVARSIANQAARPHMAEAAVGKVEDMMGVGTQATEALNAAKQIKTPVVSYPETQKTIYSILGKEARIPGGSEDAIKVAEDTLDKISRPGAPLNYGEIFESTSALRETAEAAGNKRTKQLVYDIRESLLKDITQLDPKAREAFDLYRRQQSVKEISQTLRSPGDRLSKLKSLLAEDKLVAGAFSDAEKKTLETIASHIGPEGFLKIAGSLGMLGAAGYASGDGLGAAASSAVPAIVGALVAHPAGRYLARGLIGPNGVINKAAVPALAQFLRGYLAQPNNAPAAPAAAPEPYSSPQTLEGYRSQLR